MRRLLLGSTMFVLAVLVPAAVVDGGSSRPGAATAAPATFRPADIVPEPAPPPPTTAPEPAPTPPAPTPEPETAREPAHGRTAPPSEPVVIASGDVWADLRDCECSGDYGCATGNGYFGAYQFEPGTWNGVIERAGHPEFVGVLPHHAPPHVQDAAAVQLHSERGWQPWPGCRAKLGLP